MDIKCKSYNFAGIKHFTLFLCVSHQVRDGAMSDLQTQLREVLRENELLRREVRIHTHTHTHFNDTFVCFTIFVILSLFISGNSIVMNLKKDYGSTVELIASVLHK